MAEAQLANLFFADKKGNPYFHKESPQASCERVGLIYIKQEDEEIVATPEPTPQPVSSASIGTVDTNNDIANSKMDAVKKFEERYRSNGRKHKFQQYLCIKRNDAGGWYSGTIHAIYESCVQIKFRIDKKVSHAADLQDWPVTEYIDEVQDESKGREYLIRHYDTDQVLGAFGLWTATSTGGSEAEHMHESSGEENTICDSLVNDDASTIIKGEESKITVKNHDVKADDEANHYLTKVAKNLDTKDLVGILARCFDAPAKANVNSYDSSSREDKDSLQIQNVEMKVAITVQQKSKSESHAEGSEMALGLKQTMFARFPIHCPVLFKGHTFGEVKEIFYNFKKKTYRYRVKLDRSHFFISVTNENDLTFAPQCPILFRGKPASVVSASKCGKEYSVKCNCDKAIEVGVMAKHVKFDPSHERSVVQSVPNQAKRRKMSVKTDADKSAAKPIVIDLLDSPVRSKPTKTESVKKEGGRRKIAFQGPKKMNVAKKANPVTKAGLGKQTGSVMKRGFLQKTCSVMRTGFVQKTGSVKKTRPVTQPLLELPQHAAKKQKLNHSWGIPTVKKNNMDPAYHPIVRGKGQGIVIEMPLMRRGSSKELRKQTLAAFR